MDGAFYGLNGWGIYGLNGWGIYDLNGCKWMGRLVTVFGRYAQKNILVFRGVPFPVLAWPQVSVPLNSRPVAYNRKGGTLSPPKVCFEEPSFWLAHSAMGIHSAINIQITKQIGGGAQWVELSY